MNTIRGTITAIRDRLAAELPALLEAEGAEDLAAYRVGYPESQDLRYCCVRLASLKGKESLGFDIHLALPGVSETGAYGYVQGLMNYLDRAFDPADYGFDAGEYELKIFENDFTHGDFQALFNVTLNRSMTDCD